MKKNPKGLFLIVDDEPQIVDLIAEKLDLMGYKTVTANNGLEALAQVQAHDPDAILSDINMPQMSGLDFLYEIRKMGCETPFILLTAFANHENILRAMRIGVTDFIQKPFDFDILMSTLVNAVQLGLEIKKLSLELDRLLEKNQMTDEQRQSHKRLKLALMIMQRGSVPAGQKAG
jgi:DNA-binding NtrC family response regulator